MSCTFAWTMRLAPASSTIAPSIFASSYRYCGVNGRSTFMPPENMNCSSLVSPSTISAPRWPLMMFSMRDAELGPGRDATQRVKQRGVVPALRSHASSIAIELESNRFL